MGSCKTILCKHTFTGLKPEVNVPWYVLVPVKFQVILTIISLKIQFLRWVVILTFGTHYGFGCQNSCILQSDLQENTPTVLHESGSNSMKVGLHEEWS